MTSRKHLGEISVDGMLALELVEVLKRFSNKLTNADEQDLESQEAREKIKQGITVGVSIPTGVGEIAQMVAFLTGLLRRGRNGETEDNFNVTIDFNLLFQFQSACTGAAAAIAHFFDNAEIESPKGKSGWLVNRMQFLTAVMKTTNSEELQAVIDEYDGSVDEDAHEIAQKVHDSYVNGEYDTVDEVDDNFEEPNPFLEGIE